MLELRQGITVLGALCGSLPRRGSFWFQCWLWLVIETLLDWGLSERDRMTMAMVALGWGSHNHGGILNACWMIAGRLSTKVGILRLKLLLVLQLLKLLLNKLLLLLRVRLLIGLISHHAWGTASLDTNCRLRRYLSYLLLLLRLLNMMLLHFTTGAGYYWRLKLLLMNDLLMRNLCSRLLTLNIWSRSSRRFFYEFLCIFWG